MLGAPPPSAAAPRAERCTQRSDGRSPKGGPRACGDGLTLSMQLASAAAMCAGTWPRWEGVRLAQAHVPCAPCTPDTDMRRGRA